MSGISERHKEIRRRRHRRKKYDLLKRRAAKASVSEKSVLANKLRKLSIGGDVVIANMGLEER